MEIPDGLYDLVITQSLRDALARSTSGQERSVEPLSAADAAERLVEAIAVQLVRILDDLQGEEPERTSRRFDEPHP
ncbi:MAG: hypothetical protein ACOY42_12220 [Pseudomonadota bacterium]